MKKFLSILTLIVLALGATAQYKMPDMNKLMSMTPAQREKYADSMKKAMSQQVVDMGEKFGIPVDESMLPGYEIKPPVKDLARLALIPSRPPTRTELVQQVQQSREQLKSVMPQTDVAEVEKFAAQKSVEQIQGAAIANFYANQPEKALMMMMKVATERPDSVIVWNNLGALYNLAGVPHRAIPMLQHALQYAPGSGMILNNIGQCFLALGDLAKARSFLEQALAADSLNPDANHSMGLMHMWANNYDKAMACFSRELEVCVRKSTLAMAAKMGKKFDLRALKKKRDAMNGRKDKDHFAEIGLGKFKVPSFPKTVGEAYAQVPDFADVATGVGEETMFWMTTGMPSAAEIEADGKKHHGLYHDLVQALLEQLDEEFTPKYLTNDNDDDLGTSLEIINKYAKQLRETKCPQPPSGSTFEVQQAYEIKCCLEIQQPIINARLAEYGGFWEKKMTASLYRWKAYINEMISIVELDPSLANKLMVYRAVGAYFANLARFMSYSGTAEAATYALQKCDTLYTSNEADSIIKANRDWDLKCPAFLNMEVDLGFGKIKADCNKYGLEVGKGLMGGFEHDFKTGSSTLLIGAGVKADFFAKIGKAGIKEMLYITWDKNNDFADFGVRTKAEVSIGDVMEVGPIKVGGTIIGIEATLQNGINTGLTSSVKGKGALADWIKIDKSLGK
jgi:Tfp pilus assembly protein PilF